MGHNLFIFQTNENTKFFHLLCSARGGSSIWYMTLCAVSPWWCPKKILTLQLVFYGTNCKYGGIDVVPEKNINLAVSILWY